MIPAMYQAGWSKHRIPTHPAQTLLGYEDRYAKPGNLGEADPLFARALLVDDGALRLCLLTLDLCILLPDACLALRQAAADQLGLPRAQVWLACSHTHSAPLPYDVSDETGTGDAVRRAAFPSGHKGLSADTLRDIVRHMAGEATARMRPVDLSWQEAPYGGAYNRRVPTARGIEYCWNPGERPDLHPLPSADPTLTALVLRGDHGSAVLWGFGAHPVCLGKSSRVVSADWPGETNRRLEAEGLEGFFLLGACGETHPWIATQDDPARMRQVGEATAAFLRVLLQAPRRGNGALACESARVDTGGGAVDLCAWRIGPMLLLAAPAELFASLGAAIRRALPAPLLLATNTNGWQGYFPDRDAFAAGGYEVEGARGDGTQPGDGEQLANALIALGGILLKN